MTVEIRDDRFREVVGQEAGLERLGTGYEFTEGAVWNAAGRFLIFSDMPGDHMRRWSEADGVTTFRRPSNKANGNAYDHAGRLVTCEHATSRVTRTEPDGTITVLATHYEGRELNSPNDVVVAADGAIWFTDPIFGRVEYYGVPRDPELAFRGVYRIAADGSGPTLIADDFDQPNGLCFTDGGTRLLVNDTGRGHIRSFAVAADGGTSGGEVWATLAGAGEGGADGMKIDSAGNVYCCGPGGIHVFAPDATCLGVIRTPEVAANFCWGGGDLRTLFVTASTSLYRTRTATPGQPLP